MNIDDLISRATHTSGRTLLAVSSTVLFAKYFDYCLNNFPILAAAKPMPSGMIEFTAGALILYLIIVHWLNWFTDKTGFYQGELVKIYNKQKELHEGPKIRVIESSVSEELPYDQLIEKYESKTKIAFRTQYLSLYGQHLVLPLLVGIIAFGILWSTPSCTNPVL